MDTVQPSCRQDSRREFIECCDPATGSVIGTVEQHSLADLARAVTAARQAQRDWSAQPVKTRCAVVRRVRDLLVERADDLAAIVCRCTGKTRIDALTSEIAAAALAADCLARRAPRWLKERALQPASVVVGNKRGTLRRVPFGVIGIISPWNYPFSIPFGETIAALLAGNGIILKAARQTQLVAVEIERLLSDAGLPPGLFSLVNLPGQLAGDGLLEAGVDKLVFTGSVPVGRQLMAKAAETLTPVVLELGGNDPMVVCDDADLDRVASGAVWAGLINAGQCCASVERIYVHHAVYDGFLERLTRKVNDLRVGADLGDHIVDMGAMTTARQWDSVKQLVDEAVAQGAVVAAKSMAPDDSAGRFYPATVLTNVDHSMRIMREETFGPVLCVMRVADDEEAIRLANDSDLALTASVWSRHKRHANELARRIDAGVVTINDHLVSHGLPETPWGGFKNSGIGRTHGELGFAEMTQPQCIVNDRTGFQKKVYWWHPYGPVVYDGMRGIMNFLYGRTLSARIAGFRRMLRLVPRTFEK